jgi:hypothetical protein
MEVEQLDEVEEEILANKHPMHYALSHMQVNYFNTPDFPLLQSCGTE